MERPRNTFTDFLLMAGLCFGALSALMLVIGTVDAIVDLIRHRGEEDRDAS
ncbi:MAG: hypothetical protein LAQ30_25875 [Acidobacteriia bacterium]|nr:hypothetical protein [Terriglobia bacterium]